MSYGSPVRAVRSLAFRTDLELLRLGGSDVVDRGDHLVVRTRHNPTFWWGNFLLLATVPEAGTSHTWVDRFNAEFPRARHVALGLDTTDAGAREVGWFADHGFSVSADTVLTTHSPPDRRDTVDADCRRLVSDEDWAQSVQLNMIGSSDPSQQLPFMEARVQTNRALTRAGHGAWFGAFVDGSLVAELGIVRAGDGLARYQSVLTDPAFRRRGYATALLVEAARFGLIELHARTLVIVVDPANPAIDLYRSIGFVASQTQLQVERSLA